jgi:2-dehydro-3-deoxygluconokinase
MEAFIRAEGVGTARIRRHPERLPGIYAITLDAEGERSFAYWRDQSAARSLFDDGFGQLEGAGLIYLSGITLAILSPERRAGLIAHLATHPAEVAFDPNYRPRLWESPAVARETIEAAWLVSDIALPSVDDEMALFGDEDEQGVIARLRGYGLARGALKRGEAGPVPLEPGVALPDFAPAPLVRDTTAAGDSFNGAYLAAVLTGASPAEALTRAHARAVEVIAHPGAIVPRD